MGEIRLGADDCARTRIAGTVRSWLKSKSGRSAGGGSCAFAAPAARNIAASSLALRSFIGVPTDWNAWNRAKGDQTFTFCPAAARFGAGRASMAGLHAALQNP